MRRPGFVYLLEDGCVKHACRHQEEVGRMSQDEFFDEDTYALAVDGANEGSPDAQVFLACMHLEGRGARQDYAEARKWFTRAAEQGPRRCTTVSGPDVRAGEGLCSRPGRSRRSGTVGPRTKRTSTRSDGCCGRVARSRSRRTFASMDCVAHCRAVSVGPELGRWAGRSTGWALASSGGSSGKPAHKCET